jgi:hypothetical protein
VKPVVIKNKDNKKFLYKKTSILNAPLIFKEKKLKMHLKYFNNNKKKIKKQSNKKTMIIFFKISPKKQITLEIKVYKQKFLTPKLQINQNIKEYKVILILNNRLLSVNNNSLKKKKIGAILTVAPLTIVVKL